MKLHAYGPAGFIFSAQLEADPNDICGWAASVYDLARFQQPHAVAAGHKTCRQSSRLARWACATCARSRSVFVVLAGCLEKGFVSSGVRAPLLPPPPRECPQCGEAALVWHPLPALTSDLIPLQPFDLKCHPVNLSFPTSSRLTIKAALRRKCYLLIYWFELYSFGLIFEGTWSCSWVMGPSGAFPSALWVSVLSI